MSKAAATNRKPEPADVPHGALPPQNLVAEKALLGSVMLEPGQYDDVALVVKAEDFYLATHVEIFAAIAGLAAKGKPLDPVSVGDRLEARKQLEECGGNDYLTALLESVPHGAHAAYYAKIVAERAMRRNLIMASGDTIREAYDDSKDVDDVLARAGSGITGVMERRASSTAVIIGDVLAECWSRLNQFKPLGLLTGFADLDEKTNGFQPGQVTILAARPGMGKTAFAGNVAKNIAKAGLPVIFLTLEQPVIELTDRMVSSESGISSHLMRKNDLTDQEREQVMEGISRLNDLPLWFDPCERRDMGSLESKARLMVRKHEIKIVILDYLQLIHPDGRRQNREQEVADVSRRMKGLATSLNIPVLCLAQINRGVEHREDKRPRLADLRESGAIEQDADNVLFIHRREAYDPADHPGEAELIISKQRSGPTGIIGLAYQKETMTFRTLSNWVDPQLSFPM